jgi:hypothetical protein
VNNDAECPYGTVSALVDKEPIPIDQLAQLFTG